MFTTNQAQKASSVLAASRDLVRGLALSSFLLLALVVIPYPAFAQANPLSDTLCAVVAWFTGELGQAIATLGIVVLGIGALLGKVSWPLALTVAVGVAIMFSGAQVVAALTDPSLGAASVCTGAPTIDAGELANVLCRLAALAKAPEGRALGTLGVLILGVSSLMGKVSAGPAILVATGIGTLYGADGLVGLMTAGTPGVTYGCSP